MGIQSEVQGRGMEKVDVFHYIERLHNPRMRRRLRRRDLEFSGVL